MSKIDKHKNDWEALGNIDPLWAILSDNSKRFDKWNRDDFFKTGEAEVKNIMLEIKKLNIDFRTDEMLDFGCGVGRLARHYLKYFHKYNGSDISIAMAQRARDLNKDLNAEFFVNGEDLKIFSDNKFDFVYSGIVLQHLPNREFIKKYILEFKRVLRSGGLLVFQLPSHIFWRFRFQPVRRLYKLLKFFGFSDYFLYKKLGLYPIKMTYIEEVDMKKYLKEIGFQVLGIKKDSYCGPQVESRTYYCLVP
jgi:ubiquinone/menaquinone biosynthesis C-methylase UbiE